MSGLSFAYGLTVLDIKKPCLRMGLFLLTFSLIQVNQRQSLNLPEKDNPMIDIEEIKPHIEQLCRRLPVKRLGLFGSALGPNYSQTSDVDVLVVFDSGENIDLFDKYFELKEQLQDIFKRDVDLIVDKKFKNPVLRESIDRTRTVIYERRNKKESD